MKAIIIILLLAFAINTRGQEDCTEAAKIWTKIEYQNSEYAKTIAQNAKLIFPEGWAKYLNDIRVEGRSNTFIVEFDDVSEEEFLRLCNMPLNMRDLLKIMPNMDSQIMFSCKRSGGKNYIKAFMQTIDNPTLQNTPIPIDKRQQEAINGILMDRLNVKTVEKKNEIVKNTIKAYNDAMEALDKDIRSLALTSGRDMLKIGEKLLEETPLPPFVIDKISDANDWITEKAANTYKAEILNFKNPVADGLNAFFKMDGLVGLMRDEAMTTLKDAGPYGAALYLTMRIGPEIAKTFGGNIPAIATIYFKKNELLKERDAYIERTKCICN